MFLFDYSTFNLRMFFLFWEVSLVLEWKNMLTYCVLQCKSSTSDKLQTFRTIFGISCKFLTKNYLHEVTLFVLFWRKISCMLFLHTYICTFGFGIRSKARCFSGFGFGFGLKWKTYFRSFTAEIPWLAWQHFWKTFKHSHLNHDFWKNCWFHKQ